MKLAIIGSRSFTNFEYLSSILTEYASEISEIIYVHSLSFGFTRGKVKKQQRFSFILLKGCKRYIKKV